MVNNVQNIQKLLNKFNLKLWIMVNTNNSDRVFCKYISKNLATSSMCFISLDKVYLLINELDKDNVDHKHLKINNIQVVYYTSSKDLERKIEDIISYMGFLSPISLSYTTMGDQNTDILGHGEFITLKKIFKAPYLKYKKKITFNSAEKIIYSLLGKKTDTQIERIKSVSRITNEILETSFKTMRVGMSEIEIAKHIVDVTKKITAKYISKDVVAYSLAWENCPIVLTGENLVKGGHSLPSDKKLLKGDTIYVDFGICATYSDEEKIYSDMQRMGYALKKNELKPPKNVQNIFKTLNSSIEAALDYMKPDVKGYVIDEIVRNNIIRAGYPSYNHSTGHPVGLDVHDTGAILSFRTSKRARLGLLENGVYTLEPRIATINGGSIEEMILVTKFGGIPVCKMQKDIYLVK